MSSIKQAAEEMLLQTIIPFWKGLRDEENGGFYGYMDFDLKLDKKAEKGCILNSRILWFFSEAAMLTGRADLAEDARHAYQFFLKTATMRQTAVCTGAAIIPASRRTPPSTPTIRALPSMPFPLTTG